MSKSIWRFSLFLALLGTFMFFLGYYSGKASGLAEITEIVLEEKLREQDKIEKMLMGSGL